MDSQTRQQALDNITPEDLEKVKAHQAKTQSAYKVDDYWLIAAEFARAFGWSAYKDFRQDKIGLEEMMTLIEANRRLDAREAFIQAQSAFMGAVSSQSKKPSQTFTKLSKGLLKQAKVDE